MLPCTNMPSLNYRIIEQLYESTNSVVCRAEQLANRKQVILKTLKVPHLSPERRARFKREYELARSLNPAATPEQRLKGVVEVYALEVTSENWMIVMEDFGGESLSDLKLAGRLELPEFLNLAIQVVQVIGQIHRRRIIHKDINPHNILYNRLTHTAKLIDFGLSLSLTEMQPGARPIAALEGTLSYMSPEQTGRMNRDIDYRSDYYSLGVTLYELLTGKTPFQSHDALELVHAHIARQPVPAHEVKPSVPAALSAIVGKLMAKNAEDRYQSAWGIESDLRRCLELIESGQPNELFALATQDAPDRFQLPKKLYGREVEIGQLLAAFNRVVRGKRSELLLVSGYSGIGKSSLIHEVYKPVTQHRGYFVAGKFEQFQRNVPCSAISQALSDLVRQILSESSESLAAWRTAILGALGPSGKVFTELVPDLELLIGPQPELATLGPSETENRFQLTVLNFIQVFCIAEHPLVLFLDDLQWADLASLRLLEQLITADLQHLFLIGAYRDNEVDATHPLTLLLGRLAKEGAQISRVSLRPLAREHIGEFLSDTLGQSEESVAPLTELMLQKTGGNPFFAGEFLKTLYQEQLITLSEKRQWGWNIDLIRAKNITDNVVDLLLGKLRKLPAETQNVLRLAACVGNRFELKTLSVVHERSLAATASSLLPAQEEGFVIASAASEILAEEDTGALHLTASQYRFAHDRVQQAAYALISSEQRRQIHLQIGMLLLNATGREQRDERLFEIVDHLNAGSELISDKAQRENVAQLNLDAAVRAREATAYQTARQYAAQGLALLSLDEPTDNRVFAFKKELAMAEYLSGAYDRSEGLLKELLTLAETVLQQVEIYSLLITQYTLTGLYEQAVNSGRKALQLLGIELPASDIEGHYRREEAIVQRELSKISTNALLDRPEMTSAEKHAALLVLTSLNAAGMYTYRPLYYLVVTKKVQLCLEYGHSPESSFAYVSFGVPLASNGEHMKQAFELGMMARELSRKWDRFDIRCKVNFILGTYILPWSRHVRELDGVYEEGYRAGLQGGELLFAGNILAFRLLVPFYQGRHISELLEDARRFLTFERKTKNQIATDRVLACYLPLLNLAGETPQSLTFVPVQGEDHPHVPGETELLESFRSHRSSIATCVYLIHKGQVLFLYGEYAQAASCLQQAEPLLPFIMGTLSVVEHCLYTALCAAAMNRPAKAAGRADGEAENPDARAKLMAALESSLARIKRWAEQCPENFQHKYLLIAAEIARLQNRNWEALSLYDQAIASAAEQDFMHMEALINERVARFWIDGQKEEIAKIYLHRAYFGYRAWGAKRKVESMEAHYGALLPTGHRSMPLLNKAKGSSSSTEKIEDSLDLATVLKSSQAIAGEIILSSLLAKLVSILIENAGAETGYLLFETDGVWSIAASGSVAKKPPATSEFPTSIINFVSNRLQDVVLSDACADSQFGRDTYIRERGTRSVLCSPLLKQRQLIAILYLENNLTTGAFTAGRLEMLRMLSAQIAISIENAQLYAQMEDRVRARTQELSAKNSELSATLGQLRETQQQLVHREKLASLGTLTAGIAHELRNPLNFINNFARLSLEVTEDIAASVSQEMAPDSTARTLMDDMIVDLTENLSLIREHGERADRIIHGMLMHSRDRTSAHGTADINTIVAENASLAYHGMRARQPGWNVNIQSNYDPKIRPIECAAADLGRVFINLLDNAFYATQRKRQTAGPGYAPTVTLTTAELPGAVEVRVRDNGTGIAKQNRAKLFSPFFTTKPPGEGVGLGLSISHDIIVQGHQGELQIDSIEGEFTEFVIRLPRR